MEALKTVISALDIPKEQVYVKARILEISNLKASQIGNKLGIYAGSGSSSGLYTMSVNLGGPAIAFDITSLGLSIPTIKQGLALGATIDLLETFGAAKKFSEPSILCINNTPSTIYVGKTISVKTGQTTSTSTSISYSRQDIGLTLEITPRIDSDNKVSLNVKAVVEDILPGSPDATLPTTSKRDIKTTTIVNNGQSIIIGGLVRNNKDVTIKKVPLLGDIPILGALFRHKEVNEDKTTLVIVLTPYIVKKSVDLDKLRLTLAKLNEFERKFAEDYIKKKLK
jgi:general secretion pathway protein D